MRDVSRLWRLWHSPRGGTHSGAASTVYTRGLRVACPDGQVQRLGRLVRAQESKGGVKAEEGCVGGNSMYREGKEKERERGCGARGKERTTHVGRGTHGSTTKRRASDFPWRNEGQEAARAGHEVQGGTRGMGIAPNKRAVFSPSRRPSESLGHTLTGGEEPSRTWSFSRPGSIGRRRWPLENYNFHFGPALSRRSQQLVVWATRITHLRGLLDSQAMAKELWTLDFTAASNAGGGSYPESQHFHLGSVPGVSVRHGIFGPGVLSPVLTSQDAGRASGQESPFEH